MIRLLLVVCVLAVVSPDMTALAEEAPPAPVPAAVSRGGIGIKIGLTPENFPRVEDMLKGGPADLAGLRVGDVIERIDGVLTFRASDAAIREQVGDNPVAADLAKARFVRQAQMAILGPLGSTVVLTIANKGDVTVSRAMTPNALVRGWHLQTIAGLQGQVDALKKTIADLRQKDKAPLAWAQSSWKAHRGKAEPLLADLATRKNGWHDGLDLLKALKADDYNGFVRLLSDEADDDLLVADDPAVLMLPVELHLLKMTAAMLQAGREAKRGNLDGAQAAADLAAHGDEYAYGAPVEDLKSYPRHAKALSETYRAIARANSALEETNAKLNAEREAIKKASQ